MPLYTNMKQHSVPSSATISVLGTIQHTVHTPWRSTTESGRCEGGGGEAMTWGCSSWDTSARILATFSSVKSRILSMLSSLSVMIKAVLSTASCSKY